MILLHSFCLICSGCGLSKLTLFWQRWPRANNLRFFHSTSHQKHPCSTLAFFGRKTHVFHVIISLIFVHLILSKKSKKEQTDKQKNMIFDQETYFQAKTTWTCSLCHCCETQETNNANKNRKKTHFAIFCFYIYIYIFVYNVFHVHFHWFMFHFFSCLFIFHMSFHVFSFHAFFVIEITIASLDHWHVNPRLFLSPLLLEQKRKACNSSVGQAAVGSCWSVWSSSASSLVSSAFWGSLLLPVWTWL